MSQTGPKVIQNDSLNDREVKIWEYPPLSLLSGQTFGKADEGDIKQNAKIIEKTLESFDVTARVAEVTSGPRFTQYAIEVAAGTKLGEITALKNELALALSSLTGQVQIEAPIPGRSLVGIYVPNKTPRFVTIRQILESDLIQQAKSKLAVVLGLDLSGNPQVADIAQMPYVLVAGTTGSGKSALLNSWLVSLLFRNSPSELKLILIDQSRVEFASYNGIPHLLTPVIVEVDKAPSALKWAVSETERRYKLFASVKVRNIEAYNQLAGFQALPNLVIVIDEITNLITFTPELFDDILRTLTQSGRAAGVYLILSTQRPSIDVISGVVKAKIPTRIAFTLPSHVDSMVVMDIPGAEELSGKGDMLYLPAEAAKPIRIQGAFVSDGEVHKTVDWLKSKGGATTFTEETTSMQARGESSL